METVQDILVYLAVVAAVFFLVRKYFFKKKKKGNSFCGENDCGCH